MVKLNEDFLYAACHVVVWENDDIVLCILNVGDRIEANG
jgi:hypothetical protein